MYVLSRFFEVYMYTVHVHVANLQYKKICISIHTIHGQWFILSAKTVGTLW